MANGDVQRLAAMMLEILCMFSVLSEHEQIMRRLEEYVNDVLSKN